LPDYSNPQIRDGINVSDASPLADFARLVGGILVVLAIVVAVLALAAGHLAKYIPFESEVSIANRFAGPLERDGSKVVAGFLDGLTAKIAAAHDLPPGMQITVHYLPDETVNAFATLGGHIAVYNGLMRRMPNENALAMVISHEIAHVKLRHPISTMSRGIVVGLALTLVSTAAGGDVVGQALGPAGLLTMTRFSRDQERAADAAGLAALVKVYGHAGGATDTFRQLKESFAGKPRPPELFSTHPLDDARIATIASTARERRWPMAGELTPYPIEVAEAIDVASKKASEP
jgi:beta-barrel assembly-enhancing protease